MLWIVSAGCCLVSFATFAAVFALWRLLPNKAHDQQARFYGQFLTFRQPAYVNHVASGWRCMQQVARVLHWFAQGQQCCLLNCTHVSPRFRYLSCMKLCLRSTHVPVLRFDRQPGGQMLCSRLRKHLADGTKKISLLQQMLP